MNPGDRVATVFGIGYVSEVSDSHAWIQMENGSYIAAPLAQVTVLTDG